MRRGRGCVARRRMAALLTAAALVVGVGSVAWADGTLDPSFDGDGRATADLLPGFRESPEAIAVDSQGRIVVVGSGFPDTGDTVAFVARFLPTGAPDPTFSDDGVTTVSAGGTGAGFDSVALDGQDRIVVAGDSFISGTGLDFFVARLLPSGEPDSGFSGNGWLTWNFSSTTATHDGAAAVALDRQGHIVVVGHSNVDGGDPAILRVDPAGLPDTSFKGTGFGVADVGASASGLAVAIDAGGRIVIGGRRTGPTGSDFMALRLTGQGLLDPSFGGGDGFSTTSFSTEPSEIAQDVEIDQAGRILLTGSTNSAAPSQPVVQRLTPGGVPDSSFGSGGGFVASVPGASSASAFESEVDAAGRIVLAGLAGPGADAMVARLTPAGAPDASFGSGGFIREDYLSEFGDAFGLTIDREGRYLITGRATSQGNQRIGLARFTVSYPVVGRCAGVRATRTGTPRRDVLRGTPGRDVIAALGGNDEVHGLGGNDLLCGGAGRDRLLGGLGKDRLLGGAGKDRLLGGAARDRLLGQGGADFMRGGAGRDSLQGGGGRDDQRQ